MRDKQDEERTRLFEAMVVPNDCGSCVYMITTVDNFSIGDSPTQYECCGSHLVCPEIN